MTSITGDSVKNKASDSSVSTTINSPAPSRAFAPALLSRPPMTKVGSRPPSASALAIRLVVVVLPCVPATAMPCLKRISSASISARGTTGIRRARGKHFGVVFTHSARHDDGVRAFDMRRIVTVRNARAQTGQPFGCRIANQIGAADAVAQIQQHFGDATHAGASDADKM